jgi:hypothetical protein
MRKLIAAVAMVFMLALGASSVAAGGYDHGKGNGNGHGYGNDKVTICHVPPGNPSNAHLITVSKNALQAHLDHGDSWKCKKHDHHNGGGHHGGDHHDKHFKHKGKESWKK